VTIIVFEPPVHGFSQVKGVICWARKLTLPLIGTPLAKACNTPLRYVKRIIGIAGDTVTIRDGQVFVTTSNGQRKLINEAFLDPKNQTETCFTRHCRSTADTEGKSFIVPAGSLFVLGDNRRGSSDSRHFREHGGDSDFVAVEKVTGRVQAVFWPFNNLAFGLHEPLLTTTPAPTEKPATKPVPVAAEEKEKKSAPNMLQRIMGAS